MKLFAVFLLCFCTQIAALSYSNLYRNYTGDSFFNNFDFFTANDPTHGYVNYVSRNDAQNEGLISTSNQAVTIRCDSTNVASGRGRNAVRISSHDSYSNNKNYLFINKLMHMPGGCGTWPAYWLVGPNWPNSGEVDIIEGVNVNVQDSTTLHTSNGCNMASENSGIFSGAWGKGANGQNATNCWINAPGQYDNQGCGIVCGSTNSYGSGLNAIGGGYFATEWTNNFIRMFFFTNNNVPRDISNNPNPDNWGKPYAYFQIGGSCPSNHFNDLQMVINLTFCGDWAGGVFSQDCPGKGSCNSYVQNNPRSFSEAYWSIGYIAIYTS